MMEVRWQDNIATVIASISKKERMLMNTARFLKKHVNEYKGHAKNMVLIDVYSHPENPKYPRSMDTLNSVDADMPEGDTIRIFLNPALATRNKRFPGLQSYASMVGKAQEGYRYYPAFVRRGEGFGGMGIERDFLASWHDRIGDVFKEDVRKEIRKIARG